MIIKMANTVLSNLEKVIYTAFFQAADKSKRGYLSIDELANVTKMCGLNLSQAEIAATFIEIDCNADWKITLEEFIAGMLTLRPGKRRVAKLNRELTECDRNGAGYLSYRMIENIAREKSDITEKEIESAFKDMNASDMNRINYKELIQHLESKIKD